MPVQTTVGVEFVLILPASDELLELVLDDELLEDALDDELLLTAVSDVLTTTLPGTHGAELDL